MNKLLIPLKGVIVRDPKTMIPLSPEGEYKSMIGPSGRYWRRRIEGGTVFIKDPLIDLKTKFKSNKKIVKK